jgi:hypothetical protein
MRVKRGLVAVVGTLTLGLTAFTPGTADVAAQGCHPAYLSCLAVVYDIDCEEIGWAVIQLANVYDDPYDLDVVGGPGNGWTCDGVG